HRAGQTDGQTRWSHGRTRRTHGDARSPHGRTRRTHGDARSPHGRTRRTHGQTRRRAPIAFPTRGHPLRRDVQSAGYEGRPARLAHGPPELHDDGRVHSPHHSPHRLGIRGLIRPTTFFGRWRTVPRFFGS